MADLSRGSFRNSVVVVTGASAGVGRATVRAFARQGASLGLIARGEDGLGTTRAELEEVGAHVVDVVADVADAEQVEGAAARIEAELGPIDVWVNNAMVSVFMPLWEMTAEDFRRVTEVTYLGCVNGTMAALRRMRPRDAGVIVQVGSALAYRGIPLQSAYCGAKHAIQGFNESLRCELLHLKSNVRVTMVQLPALNTPQFGWVKTNFDKHPQPVPPIYQPELAAEAIVWSARGQRREVNVGAMTTAAIVGDKIASGLLDRYLGRTGFDSQKADRPIESDRPHNLWEPITGGYGARGEFDARAHDRSLQWWITRHRALLWVFVAMTVLFFYLLLGH